MQPGTQFCANCGTPVTGGQARVAAEVAAASPEKRPLVVGGVVAAVVVAILVLVMLGGDDDEGNVAGGAPAAATNEPAGALAPTDAPPPTTEPTEAPRPEPTPAIDPIAEALLGDIVASLEGDTVGLGLSDIPDTVILARFQDGALELELQTRWASQSRQADTSFKVITSLATTLGGFSEEELSEFARGVSFEIIITTYSVSGDYRYQSLTDYATLSALADQQINNEEWAEAASAGFRQD